MGGNRRKFAIVANSGVARFDGDAPGDNVSTRFGAPSSALRRLQFDDHDA